MKKKEIFFVPSPGQYVKIKDQVTQDPISEITGYRPSNEMNELKSTLKVTGKGKSTYNIQQTKYYPKQEIIKKKMFQLKYTLNSSHFLILRYF